MPEYGVVILAAGGSTRMGTPKQLIPFRGTPLVRHAANVALASYGRVIVVLGANAEAIRPTLADAAVEIVVNPRWAEGMGTSIHAGVEAASGLDGLVLTLADLPLISPAILTGLVEGHKRTGQPIVASEYSGTVGVPVFFSRELFPELMALQPAQGCKGLILAHNDRTIRLDCPEAEMDLDTPGDVERLSAH